MDLALEADERIRLRDWLRALADDRLPRFTEPCLSFEFWRAGDLDALFALYEPNGAGYLRTKTLCYGDLKDSVGNQVVPLPGSGFVWQGESHGGVLFAPPHQIGPDNGRTVFVTSWTERTGVTATYGRFDHRGCSSYATTALFKPRR